MKRFALLLASAAFVTPAMAADVIYQEPMAPAAAPVVFEPAFTWTGFYAGGQAGVAFNNDAVDFNDNGTIFGRDIDNNSSFVGGSNDGDTAFIGGVHVGYDYQINNFIVGAVADINYIDASSSSVFTVEDFDGADFGDPDRVGTDSAFGVTNEIDFVGTVRAKVGFAADRFAVYATGGLAYADISNDGFGGTTFTNFGGDTFAVTASQDSDDVGYAVGGGVDYLVTNNFSIGVEYLYHDLGSQTTTFAFNETDVDGAVVADGISETSTSSSDLDFHTVWAKASFRFN